MNYLITHVTTYEYSDPVSLCHNLAHLKPREVSGQRCRQSTLHVSPEPAVLVNRLDYFGNPSTFFTVQEPHVELTVTASHTVEVFSRPAPDPTLSPPWENVRDQLPTDLSPAGLDAYQFVFASRYTPLDRELHEYSRVSFEAGRPLLSAVLDLTRRIHADFRYDPRATTVSTPLSEVLSRRRGVCQDFAHLEIACLRSLGLAARYVSGYLSTRPDSGSQRLIGADATHAWLSVYDPAHGWVDTDPTNDLIPSDQHILLAWGRDYDDVSPIKGVILGGGHHDVRVSVDVAPVSDKLSE